MPRTTNFLEAGTNEYPQLLARFTQIFGFFLNSQGSHKKKDLRNLCPSFSLEPITQTTVFGIPGELLTVKLYKTSGYCALGFICR